MGCVDVDARQFLGVYNDPLRVGLYCFPAILGEARPLKEPAANDLGHLGIR